MFLYNKFKDKALIPIDYLQRKLKMDVRYAISGARWLVIYQILVASSNFLASLVFANLLSPEFYGQYKYILATAGLLNAFAPLGFGTAVVKYTAKGHDGCLKTGFEKNLLWSLPFLLFSILTAGYYLYNGNTVLGSPFVIIGLLYPLINSSMLFASYLNGKKDFKHSYLYSGYASFSISIIMILSLLITKNVVILAIMYFSGSLLLNYYYYRKILKTITIKTFSLKKEFTRYGVHLSFINILNIIGAQIDKLLIFQVIGGTSLAYYLFAIAIPEQIRSLFKNTSTLILPNFINKSLYEIKKQYLKYILILGSVSLLASLFYSLVAPLLFNLVFKQYTDVIFISQIFSLSIVTVVSVVPLTALQAKGLHKQLYTASISNSIVQIILDIVLVSVWGLWGMIVAQMLGRLVNFLILSILLLGTREPSNTPQ